MKVLDEHGTECLSLTWFNWEDRFYMVVNYKDGRIATRRIETLKFDPVYSKQVWDEWERWSREQNEKKAPPVPLGFNRDG